MCLPNINLHLHLILGTVVAQWLRCCATNRKVADSSTRFQQCTKDMHENSNVVRPHKWSRIGPDSHQVLRAPRVSLEHATVCYMSEFSTLYPRGHTDRHSNRASQHQNSPDSIRGRRHNIRDVSSRHTQNTNREDQHKESKAMAIGSRDASADIMGIPYRTDMKILGIHFTSTVSQSANNSWTTVTDRIRAQALDAYYRGLCLDKRILHVHNFQLAKAWYTA